MGHISCVLINLSSQEWNSTQHKVTPPISGLNMPQFGEPKLWPFLKRHVTWVFYICLSSTKFEFLIAYGDEVPFPFEQYF